jgi:hypothetical protein
MVASLLASITMSEACNASGAALLTVLAALPHSALLTPKEAGAYIRSTAEVLRTLRHRGNRPRFRGRGHFTRYRKADLDDFMRGFDRRFFSGLQGEAAEAVLTVPCVALDDGHAASNGNAASSAMDALVESVVLTQPVATRGNPASGEVAHTGHRIEGRSRPDAPVQAERAVDS